MNQLFFLAIFWGNLLITPILFAQTKLIAHKSHSGQASNFVQSLQSSLFDSPTSNFGLPSKRTLTKEEKKAVASQVAHKNIDVSFQRELSTQEQTVEVFLTDLPQKDFVIYLNDEVITTKKQYLSQKSIVITLKKGKRNYLVFDNPETPKTKQEVCSPIFIVVNILNRRYELWADFNSSSAIIIDQIDK